MCEVWSLVTHSHESHFSPETLVPCKSHEIEATLTYDDIFL